jgi:MYXO-CTERM domain-containing protein
MMFGRGFGLGGLAFCVVSAPALGATIAHSEPRLVELQAPVRKANGAQITTSPSGALVTFADAEGWGVAARLLDSQGTPLGHPFFLSGQPPLAGDSWPWRYGRPTSARDGTGYVVAWTEGIDSTPIALGHFDAEGAEQGERQQLDVSFGGHDPWDFRGVHLAPTLSGTLLIACGKHHTDSGEACQSWAFDHAGVLTGGSTLPIPSGTEAVTLASLGDALVTVLEDHGNLSLMRLDASGAFLDTTPRALAAGTAASAVSVAGSLGAVWADGTQVRRATLAPDGSIDVAPEPLLDNVELKTAPKLVDTPTGIGCVSLEAGHVVLRFFSATWQPIGDPLTLGAAAGDTDLGLALNADTTNLIATWKAVDGSLASRSIALAEPVASGQPTPVSTGTFDQETPQALRFDDHWVVIWSEGGGVRSAKVDDAGQLVDGVYVRLLPTKPYSRLKLLPAGSRSTLPGVVLQDESGVTSIGYAAVPVTFNGLTSRGQMGLRSVSASGPVSGLFLETDWFVGFVDHSTSEPMVTVESRDGQTPIAAVALPPGASSVPFDLVAIDGGYRAWWADDVGHVRARDVRSGVVSGGPDFAVPAVTPTFLTATATAVLAGDESGASFNSTGGDAWTPVAGSLFTQLVDIDGSTTVVSGEQGALSAQLADPRGPLAALDTIGEGSEPSLSEAYQRRTLLAFTRQEDVGGTTLSRVYVSLLTAEGLQPNPVDPGSEGGAPTTDEGGAPTTDEGGAPATGEGDAPATAKGGVTSAGVARPHADTLDNTSCDCRAAGHDAHRTEAGLLSLLALALAFVRRRS